MALIYKLMNQGKEYWYIGSMFAKSATVKNKIEECVAMGLYPRRV